MRAVLLDKQDEQSGKDYSNDALACLGDSIIKFLLTHYLFSQGKKKGDISKDKAEMESNTVFHKIAVDYHILNYAYNDKYFSDENPPEHEKVRSEKHDPYIEAIAAAIYKDGGWESVTPWFNNWLLPRLKQYKDQSQQM
jgi:dsRNA-specific ribonuclease